MKKIARYLKLTKIPREKIIRTRTNEDPKKSPRYHVVEFNAFDTTGIVRGVHSNLTTAKGQADAENKQIKNRSEWVKVISADDFNFLLKKKLLTA